MTPSALLALALALASAGVQEPAQAPAAPDALREALAAEGIHLDGGRGLVALPARVLVRDELLEYLLVGPRGQTHESLFLTEADPRLLNAALLALGLEPGRNAVWEPVEPQPTLEERRAGARPYVVHQPEGDGVHLYAGWREGDEEYLHRVEDLIGNLESGRSMRRHAWVFLGSRFVSMRDGGPELWAAEHEENLVNVALFSEGNTIVTAAIPEAVSQEIWIPNAWLLPPRDTPVALLFAREPLPAAPEGVAELLPRAPAAEAGGSDAEEPGGGG